MVTVRNGRCQPARRDIGVAQLSHRLEKFHATPRPIFKPGKERFRASLKVLRENALPAIHDHEQDLRHELRRPDGTPFEQLIASLHHLRRVQPDLRLQARGTRSEVSAEMVLGTATEVLVREAETQPTDLIVLGHPLHHKLWHRLFGGTTDRISHRAPCDVLVVRDKMLF